MIKVNKQLIFLTVFFCLGNLFFGIFLKKEIQKNKPSIGSLKKQWSEEKEIKYETSKTARNNISVEFLSHLLMDSKFKLISLKKEKNDMKELLSFRVSGRYEQWLYFLEVLKKENMFFVPAFISLEKASVNSSDRELIISGKLETMP